jgi:N-acetylglutamate synthase-like GNAT family acetyltransferase
VASLRVRPATFADRDWIASFLERNHSRRVARNRELVTPTDHPMLVAEADGGLPAGLLTYIVDGNACEILTLHATRQWRGTGTALVEAVRRVATDAGCDRLWVVTTNDNVDALRFYQRRGFRLAAVRPGAVDESRRTLKPEIAPAGDYGIPLRDEIELEMEL